MTSASAADEIWEKGGAPIREIEREYGIARSRQFELIRQGELVTIMLGRRRIVARLSAQRHLERLHREQTAG